MDTTEMDTVYVNVNGSAAAHVKECYGDLGWQVSGERKKKLPKSFIQVAFTRPRSLKCRDELLLLQVRLDIALNQMGKSLSSRKKHAVFAGLCLGVAALIFFVQGVLLFVFFTDVASLVCGSLACLFGVLSVVSCGLVSNSLYKADCKICAEEIKEQLTVVEGIRKRAVELRRGEDGQA